MISIAVVATSLSLLASSVVTASPTIDDQIAFLERTKSPLLKYPTQFTQSIIPKAIHSHNDYWRDVPVLSALSFGVASIEADVWLVNNELLIGHERQALTSARTFDSLYLEPLRQIVEGMNPHNQFTGNSTGVNGVFDTSGGTTLNLLVDIKTDGPTTLPFVLDALKPLREAGYLSTYYSNGTYVRSAITVIGTGNTPLDPVLALSPRDYFFDAPLTNLTGGPIVYNETISPIASTDYVTAVGWNGIGNISDAQLAKVRQYISDAHSTGVAARFWDTPGWPISARDSVWRMLLDNGADWLNADDLEAASQF